MKGFYSGRTYHYVHVHNEVEASFIQRVRSHSQEIGIVILSRRPEGWTFRDLQTRIQQNVQVKENDARTSFIPTSSSSRINPRFSRASSRLCSKVQLRFIEHRRVCVDL